MNEQQRQTYLNLIKFLLNCPEGLTTAILQKNKNIIVSDQGLITDEGLLETI